MTSQVTDQFQQRTYSCLLRFRGDIVNTVPLECVTRDELKLLAFLHGAEAVTSIRYLGMAPIPTWNPDEGSPKYVRNQDEEYRRLARKYDTIVNSGRGKAAVEKAFGVQLIDFDAIVDAVDPIDVVERAAAEAEAKTEISAADEMRKPPESPPANTGGGIGAAVAAVVAQRRN